jgi:uroporphyrinogen decarboxylase
MTPRDRFKKVCRFEKLEIPFIWSVSSWNAALDRWQAEGMPVDDLSNMKQVNEHFLGQDHQIEAIAPVGALIGISKCGNPPWVVAIDPFFERKILREDEEHVTEIDHDGTTVIRRKEQDQTIPQVLEYPVKDRKTWEEFKKRLDPHSPGRWPVDWHLMGEKRMNWPIRPGQEGQPWKHRDFPLGMRLLSIYGNPRNYMGLEGISFAIYDDIKLVEEIMDHQAWLAYEMAKKVFESGVTLEWVWIWEDMCFNKGPLVSPEFVRKVMVPRYRKVIELLKSNGVDALIVDCDGNVDELLPIWVDCGINAIFPLECAAGMDGRKVRKKFGKNLIMIGNIDKRALAKGRREIDVELEKVQELLRYGGYFPNVDHQIPPDVPYRNAKYMFDQIKKMEAGGAG